MLREVGQWDMQGAYKYFSESQRRLSLGRESWAKLSTWACSFSYIGLFRYDKLDKWTYQGRPFVYSNTPCVLQRTAGEVVPQSDFWEK